MMQYNRVGKTDMELSAVGFGTCQLRLIPEQQAVDTLKRGFELGVNWVHTAPDYGGAEALIARAIEESGKDIRVLCNGFGEMTHFEYLFENTCRIFKKERLDLYGISCIDEHERLGHNVWEAGGMVEYVVAKKKEGRIGALFCSTHGAPDYIRKLITCGIFDAVMLSFNPLGFHVLSYYGEAEGKEFEEIEKTEEIIFPLALEHQVSLLAMKPLAGGMLCPSKAFPPRKRFSKEGKILSSQDILRAILSHPAICAVVPGTASVEEAEENARAGFAPVKIEEEQLESMARTVDEMKTVLCQRCGECEATCSRSLRISWLFREGYIWNYPSDTFEALTRLHYFTLHPEERLLCETCDQQTCQCPHGIDIPANLARVHEQMLFLRSHGLIHLTPEEMEKKCFPGFYTVQVVYSDIPRTMEAGAQRACSFWLENSGTNLWTASAQDGQQEKEGRVVLGLFLKEKLVQEIALRHDVHPGTRIHITFQLQAPGEEGTYALDFRLMTHAPESAPSHAVKIHESTLRVGSGNDPAEEEGRPRAKGDSPMPRQDQGGQIKGWLRKLNRRFRRDPAPALQDEPQIPQETRQYGARYLNHNLPDQLPAHGVIGAKVTLENKSSFSWLSHHPEGKSVDLAIFLDKKVVATHKLPRAEVLPGETVTVHFPLRAPSREGECTLTLALVEQNVTLFEDRGVPPLTRKLRITQAERNAYSDYREVCARINPWSYNPTQGIQKSADGTPYPVLLSRSQGCRIRDLEGREYIDYAMGWGTTLLGYAEPRVQQAIREAMELTGPTTHLPHSLEMDVSRMLHEDIPCAEVVAFGKNGSDVCTAAARMARLHTGRQHIMYCGYHGWQDFWAEQLGFGRSGVPERPEKLIHKFKYNDIDDFFRLYRQGKEMIAAVMIEASGPWGGDDVGFEPDMDREFLQTIAKAARDAGALLIFDEIITGYRYPQGSVQKALGVVPDLACLGKAIASGMPLSAVVGRADIMHACMPRIFYGPTFRGEIYSFAAAKASIEIFRAEPVAQHVWDYGVKLIKGMEHLCKEIGIDGTCKGPPFRFAFFFNDPDLNRFHLKRTLLVQELLKQGISTYNGVMLPSYAHDEAVLEQTLIAMGAALKVVAEADRRDDLDGAIEIPPVFY